MALPTICFNTIPSDAHFAAAVDDYLLCGRLKGEEIYSRSSSRESQITLALAMFQTHVEKGLPLDSPRLSGIVQWLRNCNISSPHFMLAPLRLAVEGIFGTEREMVQQDISATISLLREFNNSPQIRKPILVMVALEALAAYQVTFNDHPECICALERLLPVLHSETESPAVRAYAASLLIRFLKSNYVTEVETCLPHFLKQQNNGGWCDCMVETSYMVLNLLALPDFRNVLKPAISEALEFIKRSCPNGIPEVALIRNVPKELGTEPHDLRLYAAAVAARALIRSLNENREIARLQFAHASWKRQVDYLETELEQNRKLSQGYGIALGILSVLVLALSMTILLLHGEAILKILGVFGSISSIIGLVYALRNIIMKKKR